MNVFLVSDTHFGHEGVCRFLREDGTKLRPWDKASDMDQAMIEAWNKTVGVNDKVYHLGDVVINRKFLPILDQLNGRKVLIKGNHDIFKLDDYTKYFYDVRGYHVLDKFLMSHIPVHPDSKGRFTGNIHGHLHDRSLNDDFYLNSCVEHTDFAPVEWTTFIKKHRG